MVKYFAQGHRAKVQHRECDSKAYALSHHKLYSMLLLATCPPTTKEVKWNSASNSSINCFVSLSSHKEGFSLSVSKLSLDKKYEVAVVCSPSVLLY